MSILVTGASGNVGAHVIKELSRMGERIVAAGTDVHRLHDKFSAQVKCVYLDFTDSSSFDQALEEVDRVFLIRPPHLGKPEDMYPFIDALKFRGIRLAAFLSLMGIEKNPFPPHHKIEKYLEAAGIPYAHIRPGFFMQNLSGIHAEEIRGQNQIFIPAGNSRTSFIDAADIGLAAAVLLHEPERYAGTAHTITGAESLNYYQTVQDINDLFVVPVTQLFDSRKTRSPVRRTACSLLQLLIILWQLLIQFFIIQTIQSPSWLNLLVVQFYRLRSLISIFCPIF